jgi:hypothetical protein
MRKASNFQALSLRLRGGGVAEAQVDHDAEKEPGESISQHVSGSNITAEDDQEIIQVSPTGKNRMSLRESAQTNTLQH